MIDDPTNLDAAAQIVADTLEKGGWAYMASRAQEVVDALRATGELPPPGEVARLRHERDAALRAAELSAADAVRATERMRAALHVAQDGEAS